MSTDFSFWLVLFVDAYRCKEISLWWWSNPISISEGVFLCSFIASTPHVLPFSTLIFYSIYILNLPIFSFIQILSYSCCIIFNLYCKLYIFMLWWFWATKTIFYCWPFPYSYPFALNRYQPLELILTAFCITGIIGKLVTSCLFWLIKLFFLKGKSIWFFLKLLPMVGACFYVVLLSSCDLDLSMVALHTPSFLLLCNPPSYKCHFSSKISTSLCLHTLCRFSLKLCHICEVVLSMHILMHFCSYSSLFFLSIYL